MTKKTTAKPAKVNVDRAKTSAGATVPEDGNRSAAVPATQVKPSAEYTGEPMTKAPTKGGVPAFDGQDGLRARNATMEPRRTREALGQVGTASKAKGG